MARGSSHPLKRIPCHSFNDRQTNRCAGLSTASLIHRTANTTLRKQMKTLQINIGLNTNKGETLDAALVLNQAWNDLPCIPRRGEGEWKKHAGQWNGVPEETLVLLCNPFNLADFKACLHDLALALDQDCIAIAYDAEHGECIGPAPAKGGFNPEFFTFLEWPTELWGAPASELDAADNECTHCGGTGIASRLAPDGVNRVPSVCPHCQ